MEMKDRIAELMQSEEINAASLADLLGVQRSNISHILNGRNNPRLDFLEKLLEKMPHVNAQWLITGLGKMYLNENEIKHIPKNLFDSTISTSENSKVISGENKQNKKIITKETPIHQESLSNSNKIASEEISFVKIKPTKLIIFYSDNTFQEVNL